MSLDYMNPQSNFKALGAFIFGGSASIGVMKAGFHLDAVLEMTDDMIEQNAYHFHKNFKKIPIILPKEWENDNYLQTLKEKNYDLIMSNCPCSSLSPINRNASVDGKHNVQFYRLFDMYEKVQPKVFIIENAPTLIKLGFPIILDMVKQLQKLYKFTVIRDYAGNHGVPMKRQRTLLIGWRRDYFNDKIPLLHMNKQPQMTIKEAIGDLYDKELGSIPNHELVEDRGWKHWEYIYPYVKTNSSVLRTMVEMWDTIKDDLHIEMYKKQVYNAKEKMEKGKNIWDKSPWRLDENGPAFSITSVTEFLHPIHDRQWTIREYARLMGYPDDFIFYPNESKTDIIQTIAQGVPANFVAYIATEVKEALQNNRKFIEESNENILNFQHHQQEVYKLFNYDELLELNNKNEKGRTIGFDKIDKKTAKKLLK